MALDRLHAHKAEWDGHAFLFIAFFGSLATIHLANQWLHSAPASELQKAAEDRIRVYTDKDKQILTSLPCCRFQPNSRVTKSSSRSTPQNRMCEGPIKTLFWHQALKL